MYPIKVRTTSQNQMIDISRDVRKIIQNSNIANGIVIVYTPHTTAAITINENADPDVQTDMLMAFDSFNLEALPYRHAEGNSASHVKSTLVGCSEQVILEDGTLLLGTWQGLYFCEFDGPRDRTVYVSIVEN